jgi:uncharacterized iron-regulated membrane protein
LNNKTRELAKQARFYRRLHKYIAIPLCFFMLLLGITGLLLTWKSELKFSPPTQKTIGKNQLISISEIENIATNYIDLLELDPEINRIDYRPSKGIAKIRFEHHFTELQIDCYSGKVISTKQRTADIIEMIHDGSIIDYIFKSKSENTKLVYSSLASLGLILLALSGFLLWLKPKQIKKFKTEKH